VPRRALAVTSGRRLHGREWLRARGPLLACVIVGLAIGADGVGALRHVPAAAHRGAEAPLATDDGGALARLAAAPLFGSAAPAAPVAALERALVLVGTIARTDARAGFAILGTSPADARLTAVGGRLPGTYVLESVYADHVVVLREGVSRALYLPRAGLGGLLVSEAAATQVVAEAPPSAEELKREAAIQKDPLYLMAAGQWTFGGFNPKPHLVGNRVAGVTLTPRGGEATALAGKIGLRPGDVLTEVDGQPLAGAAELPAQLRALEGRQVQLTVAHKNGETAVLVVSLPVVDHDDG